MKDGSKVTFAEISKLPDTKKGEILEGMKRLDRSSFNTWEQQVAINEGKKIDTETEVAINDADAAAGRKQEAIEKTTKSILQLEGTVKKVLEA